MKKTIILISTAFIIFSCASIITTKTNKKYFEGVVTYNIEYESYSDKFTAKRLKEIFGSKMVLYFKNGNFNKEFYAPDGKLVSIYFLDLQKNKLYAKRNDTDTISFYDITKKKDIVNYKRIKDSIINNIPAIGIKVDALVKTKKYPDKLFTASGKYYFSKQHKINPDWYKNYKEDKKNKIFSIGKGIQILSSFKYSLWKQTIKAINIEEKPVNPEEIKIKIDNKTILEEL